MSEAKPYSAEEIESLRVRPTYDPGPMLNVTWAADSRMLATLAKVEAERDEARALLREASPWLWERIDGMREKGKEPTMTLFLANRIDAFLATEESGKPAERPRDGVSPAGLAGDAQTDSSPTPKRHCPHCGATRETAKNHNFPCGYFDNDEQTDEQE